MPTLHSRYTIVNRLLTLLQPSGKTKRRFKRARELVLYTPRVCVRVRVIYRACQVLALSCCPAMHSGCMLCQIVPCQIRSCHAAMYLCFIMLSLYYVCYFFVRCCGSVRLCATPRATVAPGRRHSRIYRGHVHFRSRKGIYKLLTLIYNNIRKGGGTDGREDANNTFNEEGF